MWTLPDSELPAFVSATVIASAFWPNHKSCHCADCFFSHPVSVAASCLTALYYDRVRGSPRCCSDRSSARGSPTYEPGPAQDFCLLQERLSLQILLVGGSKPRFDLLRFHILRVKLFQEQKWMTVGALSFSESRSKKFVMPCTVASLGTIVSSRLTGWAGPRQVSQITTDKRAY